MIHKPIKTNDEQVGMRAYADHLESLPRELLSITFDQLRTLLFVVREGSPRNAALALDRDQSSVVKQIEHLNKCFQNLCGEVLAIKRGRGEDYAFTETCDKVTELTERHFDQWSAYLEGRRREIGQRLIIATTTFTLRILAQIWSDVMENLVRPAELQVRQIRTKDFWEALNSRRVDLVISGMVVDHGKPPQHRDFDFVEWSRDEICFLTNLPPRAYPGKTISWEQLQSYPLVLPEGGIIIDAVRKWYGEDFQRMLKLQPPVFDVHYVSELLHTRMVEGFMISTRSVAAHLEKGTGASQKTRDDHDSGESTHLRIIGLGEGFQPLDQVAGLFGRKGERATYESHDRHHPLVLFWGAFEQRSPARIQLSEKEKTR